MNSTPSYYSAEQLAEYLKHIGFPSAVNDEPSLDSVEAIIRHHLITVPSENTEMHYTARGEADSDPQAVYKRVIEDKKGGTLCHGVHFLLLGMLLKLGYRGYNIMARMNRAGGDPNVLNLTALEHQAILIQIPGDDETYFVDVGMGFGITRPAPLKVGYEFEGLAPQKFRFTRGYHPDSPLVNKEAEEWRLQTNMDQRSNLIRDPGWITFMQFSTQPYYPKDIAGFNWLSHTRPDAILPKLVVAMIFSGGKRKGESLRQKIVAGDSFLSRTAGCAVEIVKFESEDERIAVLTESFGIECPADSKECIAGKPSAIGVKVDK